MAIHTTASSFNSAFSKLIKQCEKKMETVVVVAVTETIENLVTLSPVDTSRFKSNWNTALNTVDTSTEEIFDSGSLIRSFDTMMLYEIGDKVNVTNSLHYAIKLEYGGSQQAPQGMVRITAVEFPQILKRVVAKVNAT
jgi:hypothetical protein